MKPDLKAPVRYAVVGAGHIAQVAVLPGFQHAKENSKLAAIVSGDATKRDALKKKYNVDVYSYEQYDQMLESGTVDAVFIALPNHLHADYTIRAAKRGVHVLCEKPMAVTDDECEQMVAAAEENHVRLMIAYRLHFEEANMDAVEIAQSGELGNLRFFSSIFSLNVKPGNIRVKREAGGGTVYDLGVYCINAARYLFREEPIQVNAFSANNGEERFREIDEMTTAQLKFPGDRLAQFTSSFGASDTAEYDLVGSKGWLHLSNAYEYIGERMMAISAGEKKTTLKFQTTDQFAPELIYFSDCILDKKEPEPSGYEGWMDVRIVLAIYESARTGRPISIKPLSIRKRPDPSQIINRPAIKKPELIGTSAASQ
jgi:predicted dehydrogenase